MKWNPFGKKDKAEEAFDPTRDAVLDRMRPGFMVDYDMKTWQVTDRDEYDMGDGYRMIEWALKSGSDVKYLNLENYDEVCWTLTQKVPIGMLGADIKKCVMENGDPPREVELKGVKYYLDASGNGEYYKGGKGAGGGGGARYDDDDEYGGEGDGGSEPFIYWEYEDEGGKTCVTIEQWSDTDFECYSGVYVEEYQFSNILPGTL